VLLHFSSLHQLILVLSLVGNRSVYDILIHENQLPQANDLVKRHPEQTFVLDQCFAEDEFLIGLTLDDVTQSFQLVACFDLLQLAG
jgi:uncharacterized protein VirK/YbjX